MCGIAGIVAAPGRTVSRESLDLLNGRLHHRGPDERGAMVADDGHLGLAMCRLRIIDLAGGQQPIANEDETVWVVFNGEIYNFPALRAGLIERGHRFRTHSDTEVLVHLYEEHGDALVDYLDGMFAFAIWDVRRDRLLLARDRFGEKPLYYTFVDGQLFYASEMRALLPEMRQRRLNPQALLQYLLLDYVPSPASIVSGISKLPPGHLAVYERGELSVRPYWRLRYAPKLTLSFADAAVELHERLLQSVKRRLVSDVPLGTFLSGGLDSSTLVALMVEAGAPDIQTFAVAIDSPSYDEGAYAAAVARQLGTTHHEIRLRATDMSALLAESGRYLDEPLADASVVPTYLLSRLTREHVTVALSGDGGDEILGGYPTYLAHQLAGWVPNGPWLGALRGLVDRLPAGERYMSWEFKAKRFLDGLGQPLPERHARWMGSFNLPTLLPVLQPDLRALAVTGLLSEMTAWDAGGDARDAAERAMQLDIRYYLGDDLLVKADRASMACSLEVRAPFLDHTLVEWMARLPVSLKGPRRPYKALLKQAMGTALPDVVRQRGKQGFGLPLTAWLKHELRPMVEEYLDPARLDRQG
ncbi:MAG: asparagine synthase (glutamine-hydrolyzing), partial [Candidatus Sericytochromatia bacterium]|nr:asparagine synthase (glutamine-hydrolyzing) [Candidatus Sericytochromatia bacterium]